MAARKQPPKVAADKAAADTKAAEEKAAQEKTAADAKAAEEQAAQEKAAADAKADEEAAALAKATEKLEYQVLEPLAHNGDTYAPNEYVYLTAKEAERLSARSVIRLTGERE